MALHRSRPLSALALNGLDRIARSLRISGFLRMDVGIKCINPPSNRVLLDAFADGTAREIPPEDLRVCVDFLKDKHTLLDVGITESPHYDLMVALTDKRDVLQTEYVSRMEGGTLDGRLPIYLSTAMEGYLRSRFDRCVRDIRNGMARRVLGFCMSGRWYVLDGKHRAALCALLKIRPVVVDVGRAWLDRQMLRRFGMMKEDPSEYGKHMAFFEVFWRGVGPARRTQ